jgi:hypothetical protein
MSLWALAALPLLLGVASQILGVEVKGWLHRRAREEARAAAALLPEPEASRRAAGWDRHLHHLANEPIRAYLYAKRLRFVAIGIARKSAVANDCSAVQNSKRSELRRAAIQRTAGRCAACSRSVDPSCLGFHHIVPVARGGSTTAENLLLVCATCHHGLDAAS